jgi:hypothetical protein
VILAAQRIDVYEGLIKPALEEDFGGEPMTMKETAAAAGAAVKKVVARATGSQEDAARALLARWVGATNGQAPLLALRRETEAFLAPR